MDRTNTPLVVALTGVTVACAAFALIAGVTSTDDAPASPPAAAPAASGGAATTAAPADGGGEAAAEVPVNIADFAYAPADAQVGVGGTVVWTNQDGFAHTVTAGDGSFDSGDLDQGATFSFTFPAAGTFTYTCTIHPSMTASVVVA